MQISIGGHGQSSAGRNCPDGLELDLFMPSKHALTEFDKLALPPACSRWSLQVWAACCACWDWSATCHSGSWSGVALEPFLGCRLLALACLPSVHADGGLPLSFAAPQCPIAHQKLTFQAAQNEFLVWHSKKY